MTSIEAARLPAGVEDAVVNRRQLATAFGVSENTIDRWVGQGMPVLEAGSNGRSYQFQLSACWSWRERQKSAEQAASDQAEHAVRQLRLALLGGGGTGTGDDQARALSPKERAAIYEAEIAYTRLARERGDLVPVGQVVETFEQVFGLVRAAILDMPDRLARELALDGGQVERVVRIGDEILAAMVEAARQFADEPAREREPA
jgi:phage terminase Nu1 subunit (DNA packaging protein)